MEQQFASGTLMNRNSANALPVYGSHWCARSSRVLNLQNLALWLTELWDMKGVAILESQKSDAPVELGSEFEIFDAFSTKHP
ncbi:hypothetical protein G5I_12594 [Acromyrmex echinatior]|uniref:Uncharacterized protein n=1 Tax=Acromyrmex echinatior TaxID=103372 RepID=F4X2R3_ACREC|nr:hypothetical protein G5I_12594 [Acromyrmex echinatior]